jgi:acetyl esterase/lipase
MAVTHDIAVEDVEYLRHGDTPLLARLFVPHGSGLFPMVVDLHGGAWCRGDRLNDAPINEALARSGLIVAALDFRMPPVASYPASVADIHYAIRWLKTRARSLGGRADRVGVLGVSSGGHQGMLLAMRPHDPRYSALPLAADVDARVGCVVMCWPVIDPLSRYRYARALKAKGQPYPEVVDRVLPCHDEYWKSEDAMAEGNPVLALERGEAVELPPVLYVQGTRDVAHPRPDLERFVTQYRKAGGRVDLELLDGEVEGFINKNPASPASKTALAAIIAFLHAELG